MDLDFRISGGFVDLLLCVDDFLIFLWILGFGDFLIFRGFVDFLWIVLFVVVLFIFYFWGVRPTIFLTMCFLETKFQVRDRPRITRVRNLRNKVLRLLDPAGTKLLP